MEIKEEYMARAIELAKKGAGFVNPNPKVGAVIVKNGKIIGEGYHEYFGGPHGERNALASVSEDPAGGDIYVTLEPCNHTGKTGPCTEAIIGAGISRVIIGSKDPNPLVSGKGVQRLRKAGIEVIEDFMEGECDRLNPFFFHYIRTKTPYVTLKYAMTLDGKIATKTGDSQWISNEESREYVQFLRHAHMAILCGIGTVLSDNPRFTARIPNGKNPTRIICDSRLRIPMDCEIVKTAGEIPTIVAYAEAGDKDEKTVALEAAGVKLFHVPLENKVDIKRLMALLGEEGIDSILVEGGSVINEAFLRAGVVNSVNVFLAPKIFGGAAKSPVEGRGVDLPAEAYGFKRQDIKFFGEDIFIEYERA